MTTLLPSSSSSAFSESLHSDALSEEPVEDYHHADEIELERYEQYSDEDEEDLGRETIVITAPPWGQDEEEPVSIIIDEDMNHISLDASSQKSIKALHEENESMDVKIIHDIHPNYAAHINLNDANCLDLCPISAYAAQESNSTTKSQDVQAEKSQKDTVQPNSKGKGKRQATSDIEYSDTEEGGQICRDRGGSSSALLLGWKNRLDYKQKEEEADHGSRRKIILPARSRGKLKLYQHHNDQRAVITWSKLVNLPTPEDGRSGTVWPIWLHPAFRIESDDHMERLGFKELKNLLQAIVESERHYIAFRSIFEGIYGPIVCYGRIEEMYETVRAVGVVHRIEDLTDQYCNPDFIEQPPLDTLHCDDLFVPRYLGNFHSFVAFQQHDEELRQVLPPIVYRALNIRMINWYRGTGEVEDYQLWGLARILLLEQNEERALDPGDLLDSDLREWQQRLDNCLTQADAVTITEEYFGPLSQIDQYEKPRINLDKLWSPCQCSICNRSRKRVKIEK